MAIGITLAKVAAFVVVMLVIGLEMIKPRSVRDEATIGKSTL